MSEDQPNVAQNNTEATEVKEPQASPAQVEPKVEPAKAAEEAKAPEAAPEIKYDLKAPEGSSISQDALADIAAFAKQHKMSEAQAQELVQRELNLSKSHAEQSQAQLKAQVETWAEQIRNDKEIGGERFEQNAQVAKRFIDRFGSADLKKALDDTGLGNHPALFKLCLEAGRAMQDDKMIFSGSQSSEEQESPASILYGKNHK